MCINVFFPLQNYKCKENNKKAQKLYQNLFKIIAKIRLCKKSDFSYFVKVICVTKFKKIPSTARSLQLAK